MTWRHTSRTSCSRQPPLTLPVVLPSSATSSFAPSCRYAEPRTRTTVASAARPPARASCARRSSTSRVSSHCFMVPVRYPGGDHRRNVDLLLPGHRGGCEPGPRQRRQAEVRAGAVQGVVDVAVHVLLAVRARHAGSLDHASVLGGDVSEE